jgi:hypothetical protein
MILLSGESVYSQASIGETGTDTATLVAGPPQSRFLLRRVVTVRKGRFGRTNNFSAFSAGFASLPHLAAKKTFAPRLWFEDNVRATLLF